jgi:hypothetical protein
VPHPDTAQTLDPGLRWLLAAATYPDALTHWREQGVASLECGTVFDAVRITMNLGRTAVESMQRTGHPVGPVMENQRGGTLCVLVPAGTAATWRHPLTDAYGTGQVLLCPMPGHIASARSWPISPDGTGTLTDPQHLHTALRRTGKQLFGG